MIRKSRQFFPSLERNHSNAAKGCSELMPFPVISSGCIFWAWAGVQTRPWVTSWWRKLLVPGLLFNWVCLAYLAGADLKWFGGMGITSQKGPARREPVLKAMTMTKDSESQWLEEVVRTGDAQKDGVKVFQSAHQTPRLGIEFHFPPWPSAHHTLRMPFK